MNQAVTTKEVKPAVKHSLVTKFADKYSIEPDKLMSILKATAFKVKDGEVTNEQMAALLVVADQYGLNPFTKEIYAYPDKGGIVPIVGVDGWTRIINEHHQFDGMEFKYSEETTTHKSRTAFVWVECIIYRKDRTKPIIIREYFDEVVRSGNYTTPWDTHPKRMHRHKTLIQAARLAFGFAGIYDEDEAERIMEARDMGAATVVATEKKAEKTKAELPIMSDEDFNAGKAEWRDLIINGTQTLPDLIAFIETRDLLTENQKLVMDSWTHEND